MNKLEELLNETDYTVDEWQTFRKVERHNQLEDLSYILEEMLNTNEITQEQYDKAVEQAHIIVSKYDDWLVYDWIETMKDAIEYVL